MAYLYTKGICLGDSTNVDGLLNTILPQLRQFISSIHKERTYVKSNVFLHKTVNKLHGHIRGNSHI